MQHGTTSAYRNHGCRCDICTAAHSARCRGWLASASPRIRAQRRDEDRLRKRITRYRLV